MTAETSGERAPMFECRPIPLGLFGPQDPSYFTESEADAVAWAKANATRFVEQVTIEVCAPGDVSTFAVRTFSHPDNDTGWHAWLDGNSQGPITPDQLFARAAARDGDGMTAVDQAPPAVAGPWVTNRARPARVGVHVNPATDLHVECLDVTRLEHAQIWLPILGPTATVTLCTLAAAGDGWWNTVELAERVGVRVPKLWDAIDRLCRFDAAALVSTDVVVVRRHLPFPEARRLERFTPATRSYIEGARA